MLDATADCGDLTCRDDNVMKLKLERVSNTLRTKSFDANKDVEYVLESDRSGVIAMGANTRPANVAGFIFCDHARTQIPQERMFGLFHVLKKRREVRDAGSVCLAEFDTSFVVELL